MKTAIFSFFFLVLCSDSWAQFTCTNCTLAPQGGTTTNTNATVTSLQILAAPGTFTGNITLTGNSQFVITGTGQYVIDGVILQSGTENYGLTLTAALANGWGGADTGLLLKGSAANTYRGATIINSGYIACKKSSGTVAIPGDIIIKASEGAPESSLWFGANGQLSGTGVLSFETHSRYAIVSLNGTTQSLRGVNIPGGNSILQNIDSQSPVDISGIGRNTTTKAVLILTGTEGRYIIGGSAFLRAGGGAGLEVQVQGTAQVLQDVNPNINNVTFIGVENSRLELSGSASGSNSKFGNNVTFKGAGTILKTGTGEAAFNNSTILKPSGKIQVSGGLLRNEGYYTIYFNSTESNKAELQVEAGATFDLWGNVTIFDGLTGAGWVRNNFGSDLAGADPGGGYSWLTLGQNNSQGSPAFSGIIIDNYVRDRVWEIKPEGHENGGTALKKVGTGTQVLKGSNWYTGKTMVSSGTLKLQEGGQLGKGTYGSELEIANVAVEASQAVFEHNGTQTQVFTGPITNTGAGSIKGIFLQSGSGKSIINGTEAKAFTGLVNVTGGFLGGTGSLKNAASVTIGAGGSIGGGDGVAAGGTLTVTGLSFAAGSKLAVTSKSATDNAPGLVDVKEVATDNSGTIAVAGAFTVDLLSANLASGRILGCTNGLSGNLTLPGVGLNNTGKPVTFRWEADGLYMTITPVANGLVCNNCTFGTTGVGTPATPALILTSPETPFTGNITLTGDCLFTIIGAGNYTLSGQISGNYSLTLNASGTDNTGYTAGLTLAGAGANSYGSTTINSGYIICNKNAGVSVSAIPGNIKLTGNSIQSHLWCLVDNQLSDNTVVDFTGTAGFHLNGTTQTIAGLVANSNGAAVENNGANTSHPAGMTDAQVSTHAATLNIKAESGSYTYGGGGYIRKGGGTAALTVNIMSGTQIIQNPGDRINNVTFTAATGATPEATLEFNTTGTDTYTLGTGLTFGGGGIIKKTGSGAIATVEATYLKTAGKIWVNDGVWTNQGSHNSYAVGTAANKAMLQLDAPNGTFDLKSDPSIFTGLTGGGWIRNNWGVAPDGFTDLTINQNDTENTATFTGIIQNNSSNGSSVSANGNATGGIRFKKEGNGTQVLAGVNTYTGSTTVSAGILRLGEGGKLAGGTYGGVLEIANVAEAASQATFEHAGTQTQIFNGPITNTGTGVVKGIFLQSGNNGKSIINGAEAKAFSGQVNVTGGFLGGSGSLKNATAVNVATGGSIGGGTGEAGGGSTLTIPALSLAAGSKLVVTNVPDTPTSSAIPSLVKVETSAGAPGAVTIATGGFVVDVVGTNVASGYILKCANAAGRPVPVLGQHSFPAGGLLPSFRWDDQGLYMETPRGLACTSCSFENKTGTTQNPAFILNSPGTYTGNIALIGDCKFIVTGVGNYTLSGQITGTGSLTYIANTREEVSSSGAGNSAGVTLTGSSANNYTGLTTIQSGYLICTKDNNVAAVPHNLKISAGADGPPARIWFYTESFLFRNYGNNQLGGGSTIVDFTDTGNASYFHLNGSTQTIAGFKANNDKVTVHNQAANSYPIVAGWTQTHVTNRPSGVININAADNSCTFGGGGIIERGFFGNSSPSELTINITGGTQIIENPVRVRQVELVPASSNSGSGTLELKTTDNALYQLGGAGNDVITLKGEGIVKKTGPGTIALAHSLVLKPGGKIWVFEGTLRNEGTPVYTNTTGTNKSVLEVEAPNGSNNPTFDIYGNNSIFGGLTGGGWVQNNWAPSSDGGYNYLTLNQTNTAASVFSGIIRDNSSNNQVATTGWGKGGISLKKEGNGIQALTGANLYTGTTTVSAGTLKLQEGGRLGTMNADTYTVAYGGILEIANAPDAASQVTFEHNGSQAQIFTGNITNTGTGAVKGIFLQSGSGKSIINGVEPKSFSGQVNITDGFLGGSGNLRNAASVTVAAGGSIGGGDKVAGSGGTLTVSNLTFAAAASKLIVTSTSGTTPGLSLVEVKTSAGAAGTITAEHGFKVELVGTNLANGYIVKCSNGPSLSLPTLVLPDNSLAGKVRLTWDANGLWMQVSVGTITVALDNANMVCPKGTNPGNPKITVKATYSSELDLPLSGSPPDDYFTLSNADAKSGPITVSRVGNVITAEFDGANTTTADLSYTITYDDHRNLAVTSATQRINRQPTLSTSPAGGNSVCMGASLALQAAAGNNRTVTISSSDTGKAMVGDISATLSATATAIASGNVNFWAADVDGCKSEYLAVVVNALPVITPQNPAICKGTTLTLTADHDPVEVSTTTPSAWVINPANDAAATLEDQTATDRTVSFRAKEVTAQTNVTVEYTDNHGCKGMTTVAINTGLTLTSTSTSPVCSGTKTDILLNPSLTNTTYTWTVGENSVGALAQTTAVSSNRIAQTLTNGGGASVTVTYSVTGTSGTCSAAASIVVDVSNTQGVKPGVSGGGEYCAGPENKTYQTNLIPSVEGAANVTWTYTSSFPENQTAGVISGNTQKLEKGALTDGVKDNLILSANAPAEVCYVFRPFISCLGTPSDAVCVKIHPVPVAGAVANSAICSSSDPAHPKTNIVLSSTTEGIRYTWAVDKTNSPDVGGYSQPSRDGAAVPNTNPTAATAGPITDALVLPAAASKAQTIKYNITPWHSGCPGKIVSTDVTVHPRPAMTGLSPTATICTETKTNITLSNSFSEPETHNVAYSWTVSENTVGAHSSSANQAAFDQETLSLTGSATEANVTYTFTPVYTPSTALSCAGQPGTSTYTVIRPATVAAGTITDRESSVKACFGDVITLNATPADTKFLWLKNGAVISGATGNSYLVPTDAALDAAKYAVKVADACGARNAKSGEKVVTVTHDAYFTDAQAKGPDNGEINKPLNFTYTAPNLENTEYSWDFKDNTPAAIVQNPSHTYLKAGTYCPVLKVTKSKQNGCFKDLELSELTIKEGISTGDPHSSVPFSVYPIPAQDRLTVVNDDGGDLQNITIRDLSGKTVMSEAVNGSKATLSIAHFANGIYLLTVIDSRGVKHVKISKN